MQARDECELSCKSCGIDDLRHGLLVWGHDHVQNLMKKYDQRFQHLVELFRDAAKQIVTKIGPSNCNYN